MRLERAKRQKILAALLGLMLAVPTLAVHAQDGLPGIRCVAATGDYYASAHNDRTIRIWDTSTQQLLFTIVDPTPIVHSPTRAGYGIYDLAFSPDGSLLAASFGGSGGEIRLFDTTSGELIAELPAWSSSGDIAWSPDGTQLAARTIAGTGSHRFPRLMVWSIPSGDVIIDREMGQPSILNISWSPDGGLLAEADGSSLYLSDTVEWSRKSVAELPARVTDIDWSSDGGQLAGVDLQGTVYVVDAGTGNLLWTLSSTGTDEYIRRLAWRADNTLAATNTDQILVWDTTTGNLLSALEIPLVEDIAWLPDGRLLYGGSDTRDEPQIVELDISPSAP